jgi:hypothetical protein
MKTKHVIDLDNIHNASSRHRDAKATEKLALEVLQKIKIKYRW